MVSFCLWGLVFPLFCYPCQYWSFWFFQSEIFKRLLDETHVFERSFLFLLPVCKKAFDAKRRGCSKYKVKINKKYTISMGLHRKNISFSKLFFHLHINRDTQELQKILLSFFFHHVTVVIGLSILA